MRRCGDEHPRDFVEFPSQINEHWASHPQVFERYARHVGTGEKMPEALQEKMRRASLFNKGYDMTELLSAALLDMRWHSLETFSASQSVDLFEQQALAAEELNLRQCRRATGAAISPIFSVAGMRQVITPICGRKCWRTTATSGLLNREG